MERCENGPIEGKYNEPNVGYARKEKFNVWKDIA